MLGSCSKFEKIRKSPDNNYKYRKAVEYYNHQDYNRASELFEDVSSFFRGTLKADTISYYLADCNYQLGFYGAASEYYQMCYQNNQYSPFAEKAEYMAAYCYYKDSPSPSLDQESTVKAIEMLREFARKHPASSYIPQADVCIDELQEKLVEKSFRNAKMYYDMRIYKSSIVALKSSLDEYPNTKYREDMMWMVLESNFLLAENSVESKKKERYQSTLDEYYSFASEFPESKYKEEAQKIYEKSGRMIK
jgi:outer membrane protein assembly factor BamD